MAICRSPSILFFGCGMNGTECSIKSLCVEGLESVGVGGIKNRVVVSQRGNMVLVKVGDLKNYGVSSTYCVLCEWSVLSVTVVSSLFLKCPHGISYFQAYVKVQYSIESSLCVHLSHCVHDSAGVVTVFAEAIVV